MLTMTRSITVDLPTPAKDLAMKSGESCALNFKRPSL